MDLKEKKLESTTLYEGKIIDVYKDKVLCPNGHISYREYIKHCKASCVIAKKDLTEIKCQQYRCQPAATLIKNVQKIMRIINLKRKKILKP